MELDKFIALTLGQIVRGVVDAQADAKDLGARINPSHYSFTKQGKHNSGNHALLQEVSFDVALTESEGEASSGGIGVFFGGVGLGAKDKAESHSQSQTRVSFSVPIVLPPGGRAGE